MEELINVGKMVVELQMRRLHKREVIAAGCREAFASRFGRIEAWEWNRKDERRAWWGAWWESSCEELEDFQKEWGIPPCDECMCMPAMCGCQAVCRRCGEEHEKYAWRSIISVGVRCRLVRRRLSASKKKTWVFWTYQPRVLSSFFILLVVPSFPFQSGSAGRSLGSIRDSVFFVELALLQVSPHARTRVGMWVVGPCASFAHPAPGRTWIDRDAHARSTPRWRASPLRTLHRACTQRTQGAPRKQRTCLLLRRWVLAASLPGCGSSAGGGARLPRCARGVGCARAWSSAASCAWPLGVGPLVSVTWRGAPAVVFLAFSILNAPRRG